MIVEVLSSHFRMRWRQRVGGEALIEEVNEMLGRGYRLRNQRHLYARYGAKFRRVKILAEYVDGVRGLLIRVDMDRRTAVTVIALVPQGMREPRNPAGRDESESSLPEGLAALLAAGAVGFGPPSNTEA